MTLLLAACAATPTATPQVVNPAATTPTPFELRDKAPTPPACEILRRENPQLCKLEALHHELQARWQPVPDAERFGEADRWVPELQAARGDCEDFALTLRELARREGIPTRLVMAWTGISVAPSRRITVERHVVLEYQGWIADVNRPLLVPRDTLAWQWEAISGEAPGEPWRRLASR